MANERYELNDPDGIYPEKFKDFLKQVQGNILRSHGRGYCKHILLTFKEDKVKDALNWVSRFVPTSAWQDYMEKINNEKNKKRDQGVFTMLALTKAGYDALGIPEKDQPRDPAYRRGFWDPGEKQPLYRYRSRNAKPTNDMRDVHCIVLIALDDENKLDKCWEMEMNSVKNGKVDYTEFADLFAKEDGRLIWSDADDQVGTGRKKEDSGQYYVEHFGYRDGISNPRFYRPEEKKKGQAEIPGLDTATFGDWKDVAPVSLAFSDEQPQSRPLDNAHGSYMVFQKLHQNVPGFTSTVRNLARQFAAQSGRLPDADLVKDVEASIVGRYRTGEPVFAKNSGKGSANNFDYLKIDPDGGQCPFHAHMRRMNSRGEIAARHKKNEAVRKDDPRRFSENEERDYRIVRRGMPYGDVDEDSWKTRYVFDDEEQYDPDAVGDRGLLFMSYQSDLENYEILRKSADSANFYNSSNPRHLGIDPIIGQHHTGVRNQPWPNPTDPSKILRFGVRDYVNSEYGAYFFAPSLQFLENIKNYSRL